MTERVEVPFGDNPSEQATLLLAAAEELDLGQEVVGTASGAFVVPPEVAERAVKRAEPEPKSTRRGGRSKQEPRVGARNARD